MLLLLLLLLPQNYTHSVFVSHSQFRANRRFAVVVDGHFARVNVTDNVFESNDCRPGLLALRGMEKEMHVLRNEMRRNTGDFMVEFDMDSQSEIVGTVPAYFRHNAVAFHLFFTVFICLVTELFCLVYLVYLVLFEFYPIYRVVLGFPPVNLVVLGF